jgi:hypothetical protein
MQDHIRKIQALSVDIARHLDGGWTPAHDDDTYGAALVSGDMRLYIEPGRQDGRLSIHGTYPRIREAGVRPEYAAEPITVRDDRGAEAIAGEITRRLLPGYAAGLAGHLSDLARRDAAGAANRATAERIAKALGAVLNNDGATVTLRGDGIYGTMRAWNDGTEVNIEVRSVPAGMAVKIAQLIARG